MVAYVAATALYLVHLRKPRRATGILASALAGAGAALNLTELYVRSRELHSVPYRDLLGSMALFGFFLAVLNLVLELRHRDRSLGPFLIPAATVLLLLALAVPMRGGPPKEELRGAIFAFHVTLNMLAYAAWGVACALSVLYLAAGRSLKARRQQVLSRPAWSLPPLSTLERANRTSLGVGFVALVAGLLCGLYWGRHVWRTEHPLWLLDPKVALTVVILAFYGVILVRAHRGAAPAMTARLSVIGFLLVVFSYTAGNLLASRLHVFL
jgi:ABC-type transport system involved in cytochrome c biogenesis permease subunit